MTSIDHLRRVAQQLRTFAPEKADAIEKALAEVDAGKRDLATINVGIAFRLEKFDGDYQPGTTNGYAMVPFGTGDIDYKTFLSQAGATGYHNPMYEQDNAPGGTANPGQSLEVARISYDNMAALRG